MLKQVHKEVCHRLIPNHQAYVNAFAGRRNIQELEKPGGSGLHVSLLKKGSLP